MAPILAVQVVAAEPPTIVKGERMLRHLRKLSEEGAASIIEITVTSIIFIVAALGIYSTMTSLAPASNESSTKLKAAYVGKSELDRLRSEVDASTWNAVGTNLYPGSHGPFTRTGADGKDYNVTYTVSDLPSGARRVDLTVSYAD